MGRNGGDGKQASGKKRGAYGGGGFHRGPTLFPPFDRCRDPPHSGCADLGGLVLSQPPPARDPVDHRFGSAGASRGASGPRTGLSPPESIDFSASDLLGPTPADTGHVVRSVRWPFAVFRPVPASSTCATRRGRFSGSSAKVTRRRSIVCAS